MLTLQPREQFTIVRQLGDHNDSTTYYVQATVRNSIDDTVLKVINLTNTGNNRFKSAYEVPADVSGLGFYIDINTSVYDDSGYTTKAASYSDENETYLVFDRIVRPGGSGGGSDVDYKKIQKMLDAFVKKFPEIPKVDMQPIMDAIAGVGEKVDEIDIPEAETVELKPVLDAISGAKETILQAIDEKEVTDTPDMQPVLDAVEEKKIDLSPLEDKIDGIQSTLEGYIAQETAKEDNADNTAAAKLDQISQSLGPILSKTPQPKKEKIPVVDKGDIMKKRVESLVL